MTFCIMALIMTLSITSLSIMTFSIISLIMTLSIRTLLYTSQHNSTQDDVHHDD